MEHRRPLVNCFTYLIKIVHEHLPHFINRNCSIDGTVQTQLPHSEGKGTEVERVGMRQEHRVNLVNMPVNTTKRAAPSALYA